MSLYQVRKGPKGREADIGKPGNSLSAALWTAARNSEDGKARVIVTRYVSVDSDLVVVVFDPEGVREI